MRRLWPSSLAGQLVLLLIGAVFLAQIVAFLVFSDERRGVLRLAQRLDIGARTASVVRLLEETPPDLHPRILAAASSFGLRFRIVPEPGIDPPSSRFERRAAEMFARQLPAGFAGSPRVELGERDTVRWRGGERRHGPRWRGRARRPVLAFAVPLASGDWLRADAVLAGPPRRPWAALISLGSMGLAIVLVVGLFTRRITRPLSALAVAAGRVGRGERLPPLPEDGPREVRAATAAFNAMQARLDRFISDRMRMLAALGHDLRTPITSLRLRAEFVEDEETRAKILETLDEMQEMTEATLAFVREEAAAEPTRTVDLAALVSTVADDVADLGADVTVSAPERLPYACRSGALRRAVRNLVENAVRYGGSARIGVAERPGRIEITVEDDGPGIPPADLDKVFEPFTRLENSRSRATGGVGMGLAIARSIVRAHGGDVTLANRPERGLVATVTLPA